MDTSFQCSACDGYFDDQIRVPKQLNCLHNLCLPCATEMQATNNQLCCPVCRHRQRVAMGNCQFLPNDVALCRRLAAIRNTRSPQERAARKEILQSLLATLRLEIRGWEEQLGASHQENSRLDTLANRAKEKIHGAVERRIQELRARELQLCRKVDTGSAAYRPTLYANTQTRLASAFDACRKAENVIRDFEVRDPESEGCMDDIQHLLEAAGPRPAMERISVDFVDENLIEEIANYGRVTVRPKGGVRDTDSSAAAPSASGFSSPSAPPLVEASNCAPADDPETADTQVDVFEPETVSVGPRDARTSHADSGADDTSDGRSGLNEDPPPAWEPLAGDNHDPPGQGGAQCNGMCMPPCYECVISSSRYADAWTPAQRGPSHPTSAQGTSPHPAPAQGTSPQPAPAQRNIPQPAPAQRNPGVPWGNSYQQHLAFSPAVAVPAYGSLVVSTVLTRGRGPSGAFDMKQPQSVALSHNELVVANTGACAVQVLDRNDRLLREQRDLFKPRGVAVDRDADRVYVTENYRHVIHVFQYSTLERKAKYGGDGIFNMPNQVAVDARHKILYVTDSTSVVLMNLAGNGEVMERLSSIDDVAHGPWGVAVGDHVVVVTYPMDHCVVVYPKGGGVARNPGRALPGNFPEPRGVCIDDVGNILVADQGGVKVMSASSGEVLFHVTDQLLKPVALCVSRDVLVVADDGDSRIKVFKAAVFL